MKDRPGPGRLNDWEPVGENDGYVEFADRKPSKPTLDDGEGNKITDTFGVIRFIVHSSRWDWLRVPFGPKRVGAGGCKIPRKTWMDRILGRRGAL